MSFLLSLLATEAFWKYPKKYKSRSKVQKNLDFFQANCAPRQFYKLNACCLTTAISCFVLLSQPLLVPYMFERGVNVCHILLLSYVPVFDWDVKL